MGGTESSIEDTSTQLLDAISENNIDSMIAILSSSGGFLNYLDKERDVTPLHAAVLSKQHDMTKFLLNINGINLNAASKKSGKTALMMAASIGDCSVLRLLAERGASLSLRDSEHGWTALHFAAYSNHSSAVAILIECGCDVSVVDTYGHSALHIACTNGNLDAIRVLMRAGADPSAEDRDGATPFDLIEDASAREVLVSEHWTIPVESVSTV